MSSNSIVTLATSTEQALSFIATVRDLADHRDSSLSQLPSSDSPHIVPWTISNKYYTANVYFEVHDVQNWNPDQLAKSLPVVIFVWTQGEPYKHHAQRIAQLLSNHEVEISLAVRVPRHKDDSAFDSHDDEEEDDMIVDDFLSSHGFEFIDGVPPVSVCSDISADIDSYGDLSDGIPRLPRVIDAISTLVWPSMQPKAYNRAQGTQRQLSQAHTLFDWAGSGSANIHDEMEALERWLEEDDGGDGGASISNDPWSAAVEKRTSESPEPQETLGVSSGRVPKKAVSGFDDDFTAYVSTSPRQKSGDDGEGENASAGISVPGSYTSLGSASDFEEDRDFDHGHDLDEQSDDDEDLPTKAEIRETSARIFGSSLPSSRIRASTGSGVDVATSPISPEQEHAMASLDLGSVVTALEGMKAEIAGMTDDGERRKAAARVALGLVYGLEGK